MVLDIDKDHIVITGKQIRCTDVEIYKEDGGIYVKYYGKIMTNKGEIEICVPKLSMDFTSMENTSEVYQGTFRYTFNQQYFIKNDILFEYEFVEKPMTKEQIEKELGYKIKIVK